MGIKQKFKEWRFKRDWPFNKTDKPIYIIDKAIFNGALLIFLIYFVYLLSLHNFNFAPNIYVKCDAIEYPLGCGNPFYCKDNICEVTPNNPLSAKDKQNCKFDWCKNETLNPGFEFGQKYDGSSSKLWLFSFLIFGAAFLLNHLIHNKKFKFEEIE